MSINKLLLPLCILNLLVVFCSHKESEDDIIKAFNNYITLGKAKNYNKLSEIISSTTLSYFNNCINKAVYAPKEEIAQLPLFDKIMVFYIRGVIPKEQVYSLDAKKFVVSHDFLDSRFTRFKTHYSSLIAIVNILITSCTQELTSRCNFDGIM